MTYTTTVARIAGTLAGCVLLVATVAAPAAALAAQPVAGHPVTIPLAADGDDQDAQPVDEEPTDALPPDEVPTDAQPTDDGVVVYDPVFITPAPAATPVGEVRGVTGRPDVTPPATDTIAAPGSGTAGRGLELVLLVLGGLSALILLLGRVPSARRR